MAIEFCSLASGSSGNCQYIGSKTTHILVDAGLTTKYIVNALMHLDVDPQKISGIFITHEHSDHIKGVGPFHRKFKTPIYCNQTTWNHIKAKIGKYDPDKIFFIEEHQKIWVNDIAIEPIPIQHDAVEPFGYIFESNQVSLGVVTDLGCIDAPLLAALKRVQFMLLEANHNVDMLLQGSYPYPLKRRVMSSKGHLSNEDCANAVIELYKTGNLKGVFLGHLSFENNTPELAYETVKSALTMEGIRVEEDLLVEMTYRNKMGRRIRIRY